MSGFWRNVVSVLTGTALAQVIPVLGSLVITRQYAPAEFGVFSAWLGVVMLLGVVLTCRFETALAIESDGESRRLAVISTLTTAVTTAFIFEILLGLALLVDFEWMGNISNVILVVTVPTSLATAAAQTWQSWAAADGCYRKLSVMRIFQAAAVTLVQIIAGAFDTSASSLSVAYLIGLLISLIVSERLMRVGTFPPGKFFETIRGFWRKHRRFPLLSLPASAISTATAQLPLLIVANRFGPEIAGYLALTMRILGAPIGVLGKAVLDVFKRHAAASFRERGECRSDYIRTFKVLALGSMVFCGLMAVSSETLFVLAFGETWRDAGTFAIWLLPLFAMRFMASPLSYMVYIADKQHIDLIWQIMLLGMCIASLNIPSRHDFALQFYSAGYSLLYIIYLKMSFHFSLGKKK